MNAPTILSIDPGYDRVGWAIGRLNKTGLVVVDFGLIQTDKKDSLFHRYQSIVSEIQIIFDTLQPTEVAIETLYFSKNQKTALQVAEAKGVLISCFIKNNCEYIEYNPNQIKLAVTGYGKADKTAVEKMLKMQLRLPSKKEKIIDDTMDALAILLTHSLLRKSPLK